MESSSLTEEVRLCHGCLCLRLDTFLLLQNHGKDSYESMLITLSPNNCSLCSIIDTWFRKRQPAGRIPVSEKDPYVFKTYAMETARKAPGARHSAAVVGARRFEIVLSSSPQTTIVRLWPCLYLVPSLRQLCDADQNITLPFPSGRLIEPLVDIRLVASWMRLCHDLHGDICARPSWILVDDNVPTNFRLVDVQLGCVVELAVTPLYYALSYVWGPSENDLCATSLNINSLKKPSSLTKEALPQTIVDIMALVSNLGGRYLWVDRLCILQDSDVDKSLQIPQMDSIYSLAELTIIAASGSGAHDPVVGLSAPRKVDQDVCRISSNMALMTIPVKNLFSSSVYGSRGWTLQERELSRRTLTFTEGQVYWSCCSADWAERLCLEPRVDALEASGWVVPRIHLGNYEPVPGEHYRDFSRQHYNILPQFYALKDFSNDSDALDAITGLLRRISRVTGDQFYWGHLLSSFFDQSLSWRKTRISLERRASMCPIRDADKTYSVRFPSWSWLGWKSAIKFVLDLQLSAINNVRISPEIEFFHLDIDGRIKRLLLPITDSGCHTVQTSVLPPNAVSGSWKGEVKVAVSKFSQDLPFKDSGRLLFWTSHAELPIRAEERVRLGCVRLSLNSTSGVSIGHITELTLASDHGSAWPFIEYDPSALQSFIVISRKYKTESRQNGPVLLAQATLKVMWVKWEDAERKVASRISVGEVNEQAWINVERDWRLIILQ